MIWNCQGKRISATISVFTFWHFNMPKKAIKCQKLLENAKTSQILNFWSKIKSKVCFEIVMARKFQPQCQYLHFGSFRCQKNPKTAKNSHKSAKRSQNPRFWARIKSKGRFEIVMAREFQPLSQFLYFHTFKCQKLA